MRSSQHQPCRFRNEKSRLCPACRLFGTSGYRGRVHFTDFLPQDKIKPVVVKIGELWKPKRFDPEKRRFYIHGSFQPSANSAPQRNYRFVEAVQKETKFRGSLIFENVSKAEFGLILHALGWQTKNKENNKIILSFMPKLGVPNLAALAQ